MTMRHRLIALFVAVVFILGTGRKYLRRKPPLKLRTRRVRRQHPETQRKNRRKKSS